MQSQNSICIRSDNVFCGVLNKLIKAYIFIQNEKIEEVIEDSQKNQDYIQEKLNQNNYKLIDYNTLFITPGVIDINCSLHVGYDINNEGDNPRWEEIQMMTKIAIQGGITTVINQPTLGNSQSFYQNKNTIDRMLQRSYCDFGLIGVFDDSMSAEEIKEESKHILGLKVFFNYPPFDCKFLENSEQLQKHIQLIQNNFNNFPVFMHVQRPGVEKDVLTTSPYRREKLEYRINKKFRVQAPKIPDGVKGIASKIEELKNEDFRQNQNQEEIEFMQQLCKLSNDNLKNNEELIVKNEIAYYNNNNDEDEKDSNNNDENSKYANINIEDKLQKQILEDKKLFKFNLIFPEFKQQEKKRSSANIQGSENEQQSSSKSSKFKQQYESKNNNIHSNLNNQQLINIIEESVAVELLQSMQSDADQKLQSRIQQIYKFPGVKDGFSDDSLDNDQQQIINNQKNQMEFPTITQLKQLDNQMGDIDNVVCESDRMSKISPIRQRQFSSQENSSLNSFHDIKSGGIRKKGASISIMTGSKYGAMRSKANSVVSQDHNSHEFCSVKSNEKSVYQQYLAFRPSFWESFGVTFFQESLNLPFSENLKQQQQQNQVSEYDLKFVFQDISNAYTLVHIYKLKNRYKNLKLFTEVPSPYVFFDYNSVQEDSRFKNEPRLQNKVNKQFLFASIFESQNCVDLCGSYNFAVPHAFQKFGDEKVTDYLKSVNGFFSIGSNLKTLWTVSWLNIMKYMKEIQFQNKTIEEFDQIRKNLINQYIEKIIKILCHNPAQLLNINLKKGAIRKGMDADFIVWNPFQNEQFEPEMVIDNNKNQYSKQQHIYYQQQLYGIIHFTFIRGCEVYNNQRIKKNYHFNARQVLRNQ